MYMKIRANIDIIHFDGSKILKGTIKNLDNIKNQSEKDFLKRRLKDGDFTIISEVEKEEKVVQKAIKQKSSNKKFIEVKEENNKEEKLW